jgi:hypothetical protein
VTPGREGRSTELRVGERVAVKTWRYDAVRSRRALSRDPAQVRRGPDACALGNRCNENGLAELELLRTHAHPNIIALYDVGTVDPRMVNGEPVEGFHVAVLEFCAHKDMFSVVEHWARVAPASRAVREWFARQTLQQLMMVRPPRSPTLPPPRAAATRYASRNARTSLSLAHTQTRTQTHRHTQTHTCSCPP